MPIKIYSPKQINSVSKDNPRKKQKQGEKQGV